MSWIDDVSKRLGRNNQILFPKDMEFFEDLRLLFQAQSHRTLVLWAFNFTSETIDIVEKRKMEYINRVFYWSDHLSDTEREWADFMLRSF